MGVSTPRLTRLLFAVEKKRGKNVQKLVKRDYETNSVVFGSGQNSGLQARAAPPEGSGGQRAPTEMRL